MAKHDVRLHSRPGAGSGPTTAREGELAGASGAGDELLDVVVIGGSQAGTVRFADGSSLDAGIVIWTAGYRSDYSWIHIPGVAGDGHLIHRRGVTDVPGLYFLGLSWQHSRGSALLGFVHEDAAYLVGRITSRAPARQPAARAAPQRPGRANLRPGGLR